MPGGEWLNHVSYKYFSISLAGAICSLASYRERYGELRNLAGKAGFLEGIGVNWVTLRWGIFGF
jgi:hypothetical protein